MGVFFITDSRFLVQEFTNFVRMKLVDENLADWENISVFLCVREDQSSVKNKGMLKNFVV